MAKASRIAASQAQSLADVRLLLIALCEKSGLNVDEVLGTTEPQTREEMKAYANVPAQPAEAITPAPPTPPAAEPTPPAAQTFATKLPAPATKSKQVQSKSKFE